MNRTIPEQESLTVEFKSDRTRLPDKDLIETVVCLANTDGGEIYLGVEDDGQITGLHPQHQNLSTLAARNWQPHQPPSQRARYSVARSRSNHCLHRSPQITPHHSLLNLSIIQYGSVKNTLTSKLEFRLSSSKSAIAVRLAHSSQERQWSLATSYQTQP